MRNFLCPKNGFETGLIDIQIPEECCGVKTMLRPVKNTYNGADVCFVYCTTHLENYRQIWDNFGPNGKMNGLTITGQNVPPPETSGCTCISCGEYYEYAVAVLNFKCYGCRIKM